MQDEIGTTAGSIWHVLNREGEMSLSNLKEEVKGKGPYFDWAIGWLAREDKIVISRDKRTFRVRLKETHARTARAS